MSAHELFLTKPWCHMFWYMLYLLMYDGLMVWCEVTNEKLSVEM